MALSISKKLDTFFSQYPYAEFEAGKILVHPGAKIREIFYIKSGNVRQFTNSPEGERFTLQVFRPQSYIPFVLYLAGGTNKYTFETIDKTACYIAPAEYVAAFIKKDPEILFDFTTRLSQAVVGLLHKTELATFDDAYTRILSMLIHLAVKFGDKQGAGYKINLYLTHFDIASLLGMHRETITRKIGMMQKKGLVKYDNEFMVIIDMEQAKKELKKDSIGVLSANID